jgi:hypothetical protein
MKYLRTGLLVALAMVGTVSAAVDKSLIPAIKAIS